MLKCVVVIFVLIPSISLTQSFHREHEEETIANLYDSLIGNNLKIYVGKKFYDPLSKLTIEGNVYFRGDEWVNGTLGYQGQVFPNVTMRYHTFLDKLLVLRPIGAESIEVPEENIDFFIIHNMKFVRLKKPLEGYYSVLYDGNLRIFERHYSIRSEKVVDKNLITQIKNQKKYYVKIESETYKVKSRHSILKILKRHKAELKKILRQKKVNISQNRAYALELLGREFDRLQALK